MQESLNKLIGKSFKYYGKNYVVKSAKIISHNAVISTDSHTFVKTESELEAFMNDVEFFSIKQEVIKNKTFLVPKTESVEIVPSVLNTGIITAESNAQKVSNKLMDIFEALSESPTEETYRKAAAMVNVSNSIVNVQMAQIKLLSLKK